MAIDEIINNKKNPLVSFVIANYNHGKYLKYAIKSILDQNCKEFEIIVIDGASTDNSLDIIKMYETQLSYWVSVPDSGQSEAFNKGFKKAKGRFLTWLNADDLLLPGTIEVLKIKSEQIPDAKWFAGNMVRFNNKNEKITEVTWGPHVVPKFYQNISNFLPVFGPTTFFKKEIYEEVGPISRNFDYTMDTEYWARIISYGFQQYRLNHLCWAFRLHGESKTSEDEGIKLNKSVKLKIERESKMIKEMYNIENKIIDKIGRYLLRLLDLSIIKYFYYNIAYKGKSINNVYKYRIN